MKDPARSKFRLAWAVSLGVVLLAVLSLALWMPQKELTPHGPSPIGRPEVPATAVVEERGLEPVDSRAFLEVARSVAEPAVSDVERVWGAAFEPLMTEAPLDGTLRVWSPSRKELPPGDGWIEFRIHRGSGAAHHRAQVRGGAWSIDFAELRDFERLTIADIWTHGGPAALMEKLELRELPASRTVELRARQTEPTVLRVVDATSGLDLAAVSIAKPRDFPYGDLAHPGMNVSGRLVLEGQNSPLTIPESFFGTVFGRTRDTFSVVASGYAWQLVRLDLEKGGERRIDLKPAGTLIVNLEGVDQDAAAELRLTSLEIQQLAAVETVEEDGPMEISGLAPGTYRVRVEVGPWFDNPLILGEAEASVVAGARTEMTLALAAAPALQLTNASGLVLVSDAWMREDLDGSLDLIGTPLAGFEAHHSFSLQPAASSRPGFRGFSWHEPKLQVGPYELEIHDPPFKERIEVAGIGQNHFVMEIPPPVELVVSVVDAFSGQPIETEELHWYAKLPEGVTSTGTESALATEVPGQYLIRAPAAPIALSLWEDYYLPATVELDLSRSPGVFTLSLTPACGFTLRLMDGGSEIPVPDHWSSFPEPAEGTTGQAGTMTDASLGRRFQVSEPGVYTLDPVTPPGYETLQQLRIEVFASEWRTIEVPLVRKVP